MDEQKAADLFEAWFIRPLNFLEENEKVGPNAGWVALMVALPLYERWIYAKLETKRSLAGKKNGKRVFFEFMAKDLRLGSTEQAAKFWKTMRDGVLHRAMPKTGERRKHDKSDD